jgi:hypothetical protein
MNNEQCNFLVEALDKLTDAVLRRGEFAPGGPVLRGQTVVLKPGETLIERLPAYVSECAPVKIDFVRGLMIDARGRAWRRESAEDVETDTIKPPA